MAQTPLAAVSREARLAFMVVGAFSFFLNLLILVTPLYMFQVFDRVLTSGSAETLIFLTLIAIAGTALYGSLEGVRGYLLARLGHWMERRLTRPVLIQSFGQMGTPGLLRDYLQVQNFVASPAVNPFFDAPWVPLFLLVMWVLHPLLGVLAVVGAVVLAGLAFLNEKVTRSKIEDAQKGQSQVITSLGHAARNAEVIEALNMGPALAERLGQPLDLAQDKFRSAADTSGLVLGAIKFFRLAVQVGVLGLGAYLVLAGELSPGGMIAGSIILGRALAPIEQALGAWRGFIGARAAYANVKEAFENISSTEERTTLPEPAGELVLEEVSFMPPGSTRPILKRISFEAHPGEVLGIVGPSAAGKSMLCRLMAGVWMPQAGAVRLDGAEVGHWNRVQFAGALGYLPQDVELFAGTVKDNIARMGLAEDEAVVNAAKLAGAHEMILRLSEGYDTSLGPGGGTLSAGQSQRIGLARALYGEPKLLILDEPNSNLDEEGERALLGAILQMKQKGSTVILVAHRRTILQVVDKLVLVREGMVAAFGPRDKVLAEMQAARSTETDGNVTKITRGGTSGEAQS